MGKVKALHLWTLGDDSVGIGGETAEVTAPGWLLSPDDYAPEEFTEVIEAFRAKVREAFEVLWSGERVYAMYDFELRAEDGSTETNSESEETL